MEDTYRNLRPDKVEKPRAFHQLVNDVVKPAATNAGKQFLENALKQAGAKLLEGKVDPDSIEAMTKVRDKLKLKNEIKKLEKNDPDDDLSWGDKIKKQTWERNKKMYDAEDAAEEADRKAAEQERKKVSKANEARVEFETRAAGQAVDASNRRKAAWERNSSAINDAIDWDTPVSSTSVKHPTDKEWNDFVNTYSWGLDRPVTRLDDRTVRLGRSYTGIRYSRVGDK
jgi:hypothetical protein